MEGKARLANAAPVSIAPEPGILSVSGLDRYAGMRQLLLAGLFVDQGPAQRSPNKSIIRFIMVDSDGPGPWADQLNGNWVCVGTFQRG
jgi:hypothetical protein